MRTSLLLSAISLAGIAALGVAFAADMANGGTFSPDRDLVARGRYVALTAGCNDCHTPGYAANNGDVPEELWLTGDSFGWRGPWGTTYGTNLRLFVDTLSEEQWIEIARTLRRRPPMPWFNLNRMRDDDLRALYHFMRSLGDPGVPGPSALPPDQDPATPHARWIDGTP